MWISIDQILCLKTIQECGSITSASQELHRAKSAIHYSMNKLEEQVGFPILENSGYRSHLTRQASQFLISAEQLLSNYETLKERVHQIATGVESQLAISATALFPLSRLNQCIRKLQNQFPQTEIVFHRELLSGQRYLKNGVVDIAIFEHEHESPDFELKKIDQVKMHLVISKKHPLSSRRPSTLAMEDLLEYPQVIQRATIPLDENYGIHSRSRHWTVSDLATKKQILLDGLGWGRLPEHEIQADLKAGRLIPLGHITPAETVSIYMGRKKDTFHGKVGQELWDMF